MMRVRACFILLIALCVQRDAIGDGSSTTRHLLAGVRAFKENRYAEALVELRVVARAPDAPADLAFYLGPTLYKLGRYHEAIAVFVSSRAPRDGLSDFYLGQAYYQAKLYRKARRLFAELRTRGLGPALDAAAARYVEAVDDAYKTPPTQATIDVYIAQGSEVAITDPLVAGEILDEARLVEGLPTTRHRHDEIIAGLGTAWNAAGRASSVVEVLAIEKNLSYEGTWQLARAYVSLGDKTHAKPLLQAIANDKKGPRASEAAGLLATLGG